MKDTLYLVREILPSDSWNNLVNSTSNTDTIVFLDDASYNVKSLAQFVTDKNQFYLVQEHAEVRHLNVNELVTNSKIELIQLEQLPALFITHKNIITWKN